MLRRTPIASLEKRKHASDCEIGTQFRRAVDDGYLAWVVLFGLGGSTELIRGWMVCLPFALGYKNGTRKAVWPRCHHRAWTCVTWDNRSPYRSAANESTASPRLSTRPRRFSSLYGVYRMCERGIPLGRMRVGFGDPYPMSFLMASAHGAGLMLIPVFLATTRWISRRDEPSTPNRISCCAFSVIAGPGF